MNERERKNAESKDDPVEAKEDAARKAAAEVISPAMPPAGAALVIDSDPRLNQSSETEDELKQLVKSNDDAEHAKKK